MATAPEEEEGIRHEVVVVTVQEVLLQPDTDAAVTQDVVEEAIRREGLHVAPTEP